MSATQITTVRHLRTFGGCPGTMRTDTFSAPLSYIKGHRPDGGVMFAVRIHGRGGQGVVTAAELLSVAAFAEGRHAQAFPSFGSERTGAPVMAFCRIDDRPIRLREPIQQPDALIVGDSTLLHQVDVFAGLPHDGTVLINSQMSVEELGIGAGHTRDTHLVVVPATQLAREHVGRPVPNAALLGGFAALTGLVSLDSVAAAIRERFRGGVGEGNVAAARQAYEMVTAALAATADTAALAVKAEEAVGA